MLHVCRDLELHYPRFPSEAEFANGILSYEDLEQHSEMSELKVLSMFSQGWRKLQAGGLLLPDLIELYKWIHMELGRGNITVTDYCVLVNHNYLLSNCETVNGKSESCKLFYNATPIFLTAHLVTYEGARKLTIFKVIQIASKKMGDHIVKLYERVKKGYNDYVELLGGAIGAGACAALRQGNRVYTIEDDIPLLHFISGMIPPFSSVMYKVSNQNF